MTKKVNIDIVARDKTKRAVESSKKGLAGLSRAAKTAGVALAALASAKLVSGIIGVTSRYEDLQDSLVSVTKSARGGAEAFAFINDFATRSQFGVEDLARSFITLKASGIEPTEKLLRTFTDTAAVTTDGLGTLDAMTRVFSRGVQGGLGLEELNQIADRGVPVFKILETQLGITRLEIAKFGQTTEGAKDILNALQTGFDEEFGGATETKLDNLSTSTSNLSIALANAANAFGEAGFRGALTNALTALTGFIQTITPAIELLGAFTGKIIHLTQFGFAKLNTAISAVTRTSRAFFEFIGVVDPALVVLNNTMSDAQRIAGGFAETLKEDTTPALTQFEQDILDLEEALQPLGDAFATAFAPLDEALAKSEENRKQTLENSFRDFKNTKFKEIDFEKMTQKEREQMTKAGFRTALSEGAKHNKAMFRLNQALNIGEAIMNTATGITSALKLGPVGIPLAIAIGAMGAVQIAAIASQQPPAQFGGSRLPNSPFLVGEKGPELFTPNTAGSVTPNHQLGGGGATVNFNITTVDASSFGALLDTRRGQIVNMINSALNNKGQAALV